jgi:hypothetical protein
VVTATTYGNKLRVGDVNGDHKADLVGVVGGALQHDVGDGKAGPFAVVDDALHSCTGDGHGVFTPAFQGGAGWNDFG